MGQPCEEAFFMNYPKVIHSGFHGKGHCQGIAVDRKNGWIYYSFTTRLIKSDLSGRIVGSVRGIVGHLGCIDFCDDDGRVYGSLEYKNDSIGRGILRNLSMSDREIRDGFYCAIFDVDKIDRMDMDAERDGVMRAVYLPEVVADYEADVTVNGATYHHRYGCSGIDGTAWGPAFGQTDGKPYLNICYGIYGDVDRPDNDYQVIRSYDAAGWWDTVAQPLNQNEMHRSGADSVAASFVYTGNTDWGVQNLEYDPYGKRWLLAVYRGHKEAFPNYRMFAVDAAAAPEHTVHNVTGEPIRTLKLAPMDREENGIQGTFFRYGQTGMADLGDGYYYFADAANDPQGQYAIVRLYKAENGTFVLAE
jgi:hypothetical protein